MSERLARWTDVRPGRARVRAASIAVALLAVGAKAVGAQVPTPPPSSAIPTCTSLVPWPSTPEPTTAPSPIAPSDTAPTGELTVFAAASLRGAFEAFESAYETATDLDLLYSFDASSFLRTQIAEGAPADVFAAADTVNAQALLDAGLATDPVAFACNQLTVIIPAANPAGIDSVDDLATPGVRIVAASEEVPITRYASHVVDAIGITEDYETNVVSEEDNVAAVRAKIELGEGDAAIVYVTDARTSGNAVTEIPIPPEANVLATYTAVAVVGSDQPHESLAFLEWLVGPDGRAALAGFGFQPGPGRAEDS